MSLVILYYISGIIGVLVAVSLAGKQLLKSMKTKWIEEGAQARAITENSNNLVMLNATMNRVSEKLDGLGEKILDHETRIHWLERVSPESRSSRIKDESRFRSRNTD